MFWHNLLWKIQWLYHTCSIESLYILKLFFPKKCTYGVASRQSFIIFFFRTLFLGGVVKGKEIKVCLYFESRPFLLLFLLFILQMCCNLSYHVFLILYLTNLWHPDPSIIKNTSCQASAKGCILNTKAYFTNLNDAVQLYTMACCDI